MKHIFFIIMFFFSNFIFAQENKITNKRDVVEVKYIIYINYDVPLSRESELLIDNSLNESLYRIDYDSEVVIDDSKLKLLQKEIKNVFKVRRHFRFSDVYINSPKEIITAIDWIGSKSVRYEEPIPKFNWKLSNETKVIENYVCHKAEVDFRGRKYTVWYTKEIPLPYGPWKFYGLPGLILEAQDSEKRFTILAKEIKFNSDKNIDEISKTDLVLSLREFVEKHDEHYNPNNWGTATIKISQEEYIRTGMERRYEWEE